MIECSSNDVADTYLSDLFYFLSSYRNIKFSDFDLVLCTTIIIAYFYFLSIYISLYLFVSLTIRQPIIPFLPFLAHKNTILNYLFVSYF